MKEYKQKHISSTIFNNDWFRTLPEDGAIDSCMLIPGEYFHNLERSVLPRRGEPMK